MMNEKHNILIVGFGGVASALAKKLVEAENVSQVFVAPALSVDNERIKSVDIREDDLTGLLKFVLENDITLTIPVSEKALKSDIVAFFQSNGQRIFGPTQDACNIALNKVAGKKFLYKIHAQTAKFGVFDKLQVAEDYLKTATFPVIIKCSEYNDMDDRLVCPTMTLAREFLEILFSKGESSVLIEEYTYGHNFSVYYVTDGYSAIPLTTVANYKFTQDGDGGILTNGVGCFAPDYKISEVVLSRVENVVRNSLVSLEKKGKPYVGIFGVDCTLTGEDKFYVNEFRPFLQDFDASSVLNLVEDNLVKMFVACDEGLFSDEYNQIITNDKSSISVVVLARAQSKEIKGLELIDYIEYVDFIDVKTQNNIFYTKGSKSFVLTRVASTLSRAKNALYEDLNEISFDGCKYRSDIAASLSENF